MNALYFRIKYHIKKCFKKTKIYLPFKIPRLLLFSYFLLFISLYFHFPSFSSFLFFILYLGPIFYCLFPFIFTFLPSLLFYFLYCIQVNIKFNRRKEKNKMRVVLLIIMESTLHMVQGPLLRPLQKMPLVRSVSRYLL